MRWPRAGAGSSCGPQILGLEEPGEPVDPVREHRGHVLDRVRPIDLNRPADGMESVLDRLLGVGWHAVVFDRVDEAPHL
jgi:hypothetical protein